MGKWISVEERLPEDNSEVLISHRNSAGIHVQMATWKNEKFYYVAETNAGYYEETFSRVTHWQPLPAPPGADEGAEKGVGSNDR